MRLQVRIFEQIGPSFQADGSVIQPKTRFSLKAEESDNHSRNQNILFCCFFSSGLRAVHQARHLTTGVTGLHESSKMKALTSLGATATAMVYSNSLSVSVSLSVSLSLSPSLPLSLSAFLSPSPCLCVYGFCVCACALFCLFGLLSQVM